MNRPIPGAPDNAPIPAFPATAQPPTAAVKAYRAAQAAAIKENWESHRRAAAYVEQDRGRRSLGAKGVESLIRWVDYRESFLRYANEKEYEQRWLRRLQTVIPGSTPEEAFVVLDLLPIEPQRPWETNLHTLLIEFAKDIEENPDKEGWDRAPALAEAARSIEQKLQGWPASQKRDLQLVARGIRIGGRPTREGFRARKTGREDK